MRLFLPYAQLSIPCNSAFRSYCRKCTWHKHDLKTVKPHRFLGYSFPCQKQSALLRNKTIRSVKNKNDSEVAIRYLESRFNCKISGAASTFEALTGVVFISLNLIPGALNLIPGALSLIPGFIHFQCFVREVKTCSIAEKYLKCRIPDDFPRIKELSFRLKDKSDINKSDIEKSLKKNK